MNAKWQIPVPYGSMLHIPPTNFYLLAAKQNPYQKAYLLTKNIQEFFWKSSEEWTCRQKKIKQKSNRTRQKNKRGDSKVESNDSPEIPDRGETSDIPGLPSGAWLMECSVIWVSVKTEEGRFVVVGFSLKDHDQIPSTITYFKGFVQSPPIFHTPAML